MRLNSKGFAISTMMYMILVVGVVLVILTLALLSSRRIILDKIKSEAENNIYNVYGVSYGEVLETLKQEAITYATNNSITKTSIKISDLTSIDKKILNEYELSNKFLTIQQNNQTYDVYLGKDFKVTDLDSINNKFIDIYDYKIYGNSVQKILPQGYQEVDYIESTGTQFIDIKDFKNGDTIEAIANFNGMLINCLLSYTTSRNFTIYFRNLENLTTYGNVTIDSSEVSGDYIELEATITGDGKFGRLFSYYPNSSGNYTGRMVSFIHKRNGETYENLIPCYRKSDDAIGLYDVVSDTFYVNQGTGSFRFGRIVSSDFGDLVNDSSDSHYNEYNIPISAGDETLNIYLQEPLRCVDNKCDYIDFKNGKIVRNVKSVNGSLVELGTPIEQEVELPNTELLIEHDSLSIDTYLKPNKLEFVLIEKIKKI